MAGKKRRVLTKAGFMAWLRGFKAGDIVGQRRKGDHCPLALYLKDQGYRRAFVDGFSYELYGHPEGMARDVSENTPRWAERVIDGVDSGGPSDEGVTALEVRRILRQPAL